VQAELSGDPEADTGPATCDEGHSTSDSLTVEGRFRDDGGFLHDEG
jgi:hypothetical protein